jgi:glycerol uptake facilitator-like aquaporin
MIRFKHKTLAEFFGTALLLAVVTGSGIMGVQLAQGNDAIALLANSIATGCGLFVLISTLGPVSGAQFNPVVSFYFYWQRELTGRECLGYVLAQTLGALLGVLLTHAMFDLSILQIATKQRAGLHLWLSEFVATGVLLAVIILGLRHAKQHIAMLVALTVTAGYWFTASTFFANPAVTLARSVTDTFVGIAPSSVFGFVVAQGLALVMVCMVMRRGIV